MLHPKALPLQLTADEPPVAPPGEALSTENNHPHLAGQFLIAVSRLGEARLAEALAGEFIIAQSLLGEARLAESFVGQFVVARELEGSIP